MSIQTVPPDDRRRGNRRYAASVRTRGQDFRDRQSDEFVEFFLPNSINRKSKNQQRPERSRRDPKSITSSALFLLEWLFPLAQFPSQPARQSPLLLSSP